MVNKDIRYTLDANWYDNEKATKTGVYIDKPGHITVKPSTPCDPSTPSTPSVDGPKMISFLNGVISSNTAVRVTVDFDAFVEYDMNEYRIEVLSLEEENPRLGVGSLMFHVENGVITIQPDATIRTGFGPSSYYYYDFIIEDTYEVGSPIGKRTYLIPENISENMRFDHIIIKHNDGRFVTFAYTNEITDLDSFLGAYDNTMEYENFEEFVRESKRILKEQDKYVSEEDLQNFFDMVKEWFEEENQ